MAPLRTVVPLDHDLIEERPQPPISEQANKAPITATFRQNADGHFRRVECCGAAAASAASRSTFQASVGTAEDRGSGGATGLDSRAYPLEDVEVPAPSFEMRMASVLCNILLAPSAFAPGLLAGAAIFEMTVLLQLPSAEATSREREIVSGVGIYFAACLHCFRLMLWGAAVSFVGVVLQMLARSRSNHYALQTWRKVVDILLLVVYAAVGWMTFSIRQSEWTFSSPKCVECEVAGPYLVSFSSLDYTSSVAQWRDVLALLQTETSVILGRDVLSLVGAALSLMPAFDEYFARPATSSHMFSIDATPPSRVPTHVLRGSFVHAQGGVSLLVGFWSLRDELERRRPMPRALAGGPVLRALPAHAMRRSLYASRVCWATICLTLNLALNVLTDSMHWSEASYPHNWANDIYVAITFVVGSIATHLAFDLFFFLALFSTAHFRLGRYADLAVDFGGAMLVMLFSLVSMLALRVPRIAMAARKDAFDRQETFWTAPPLGVPYSFFWGFNLAFSAAYYVKGISALRRLSASEYHVHPENLRRRDHASRGRARFAQRNQLHPCTSG